METLIPLAAMEKKICIVGVGLIGASLAKSLRRSHPVTELVGVDTNLMHVEYAATTGIIHRVCSLEEGVKDAGLVFLALPVDVIVLLLPKILDLALTTETVVVDLGSTKAEICSVVSDHPARKQFVAAHPIAGTEHTGPQHSFAELFDGKRLIICEEQSSAGWALARVRKVFEEMGMQITSLDPVIHDRSYAYVSHLSHAIAYALGVSVLEMEREIEGLRELSGTGFSSTVRLAKSGHRMWVPVLSQNAEETGKAIDAFIAKLEELKSLMHAGDKAGLRAYIEKANEIGKFTGD